MSDDAVSGRPSTARETIRTYYDALRAGDPLGRFFAADANLVKFGISERLVGKDDVDAGLREQTETTTDWTVTSRDLRVTERDRHAWFADDAFLAWTEVAGADSHEFETRWSGTLERRDDDGSLSRAGEWTFVGMHVSTAGEI